jgi:hypothetical protein
MPVKYWSFAGLMLTYWCNARCDSCYLCCGPDRGEEMDVEAGLALWRGLIQASPGGCRVHISGGEPFGDWRRLLELCRRAKAEGLGPLQAIETNAYWACDERTVRERLGAMDEAGMGKLCISCDPYHQAFVPIERCRLAAAVGESVLGAVRVQVRWRDWLTEGFDTDGLDQVQRAELFARYAARRRERLNGRAADMLARHLPRKGAVELADSPCRESLLRSRHVHVDGQGRVMPGTCAGILLGTVRGQSVADLWRRLNEDHAGRGVVGVLAERGPAGLLPSAQCLGFVPQEGYAGKCHLCWDVRRFLAARGLHAEELAPAWIYEAQRAPAPRRAKGLDGKACGR